MDGWGSKINWVYGDFGLVGLGWVDRSSKNQQKNWFGFKKKKQFDLQSIFSILIWIFNLI